MKKLTGTLGLLAVIVMTTGCVASLQPLAGVLYTDAKDGMVVSSNQLGAKTGTATSQLLLGVAYGDSSIQTAAQNGGITQISTVDTQIKSILGVYVEKKTIVTGN